MPSFRQQVETHERWRRFLGIERAPAGNDRAVLTFDDGPCPDGTSAVLDALDAAGARATFFLLGEQLMSNVRLGRVIADRGHEIGLHGFAHDEHDGLSAAQTRDDLARGLGTVEVATGVRPRWYRPPYGRLSEASAAACQALSLTPVYWSAWGSDWEPIGPGRIAELVCRDLDDGAIVLLHDSARYAARESALATAEAIAAIAAEARARGLELTTLGEATAEAHDG